MSICKYTDEDLKELDQIIKWEPRSKNTLGKQSSDERLYMIRENIRKGIKLLKEIYKETKLKVTCFMVCLIKMVDQSCMENRKYQRGELHSRGSNKANAGY